MKDRQLMTEEHREWNREHVYWLEDLTRWREEHSASIESLERIIIHLRDSEKLFEEQRQSMVAHEQELAHHQRGLDQGVEHDSIADQLHEDARRSHDLERETHRALMKRHQLVKKKITELLELVESEIEVPKG